MGRRLRELHKSIKGQNPDGSHYHALEPEAYAWVQATLFEGAIRAHLRFVGPLSTAQIEQMYAEFMPLGRLIGIRPGDLPETWSEFLDYYETTVNDTLVHHETVDRVLRAVLRPRAAAAASRVPRPALGPAADAALAGPVADLDRAPAADPARPLRGRMEARQPGRAAGARRCLAGAGPGAAEAGASRRVPTTCAGAATRSPPDRSAPPPTPARTAPRRTPMPPEAGTLERPGSLLELAMDPGVAPPGDATSERILDAALELVAEGGARALTMDAVAARARVGRMTVYRRFGDRAALEQALGIRETRRGLAEVAAAQADPGLSAPDRIAEGFVAALRVAREHPLFSRISPVDALAAMNAHGAETVELARSFIEAQIRDGQARGEMREGDPRIAAELLLRLGVSFLLMPRSVIPLGDEDEAREVARTLIAPIVA